MLQNNYRLDIQGMRAIAVLLVFFAHANWFGFSGGFVGVDIFFVISGYVITQLLFKQYQHQGTITLHQFYARRLQRLFPLLLITILVTSLVSFLVMIPLEQLAQYDSAKSAVLWLSNLFFINSNVDYFAFSSRDNIYLHTWSLGVEEQFYLLWPLLILLAARFAPKSWSKSSALIIVIITVTLTSFLFLAYMTNKANNYAFYLMFTRAWQFGLGALILLLHTSKNRHHLFSQPNFTLEAASILGVALLFFATTMFDHNTPYPNWQVLLPTIGTALLLLPRYTHGFTFIGKLLATKPLVFIGNISYSFYLWHWVLLLISMRMVKYFPFMNTAFAFLLTFIISILTYRFIETPFRNSQKLRKQPKLVIIGSLSMMALMVLILNGLESYSSHLSEANSQKLLTSARYNIPVASSEKCNDWYHSAVVKKCEFGNTQSKNKIVLFGDSQLTQWSPAIIEHYEKLGWHIVSITKNGCPIINRSFFYYRILSVYTVCDNWRNAAIKDIQDIRPKILVMGNSSGYPFTKTQWIEGSKEIIQQLLPFVDRIKLIAGTPKLDFDGPYCLARARWMSHFIDGLEQQQCARPLHNDKTWNWQELLTSDYDRVQFINLANLICPNNICMASHNQQLTYRDSQHLSIEFVLSLKQALISQLEQY
jgi:peptidoglycan/LPS O-acetylase OafA/YrhL